VEQLVSSRERGVMEDVRVALQEVANSRTQLVQSSFLLLLLFLLQASGVLPTCQNR